MPDQDQHPPRHHLLIAGTGRAGTSFLVRWLAAAGLRTHLATHATPHWDEDANAGLEDLQAAINWEAAPYVVKSPWFVEVIDEVLANPRVVVDGVIIPVRDLTEAAASRVVHELHAAHRKNPWMSGFGRSFEQWGTTPGGVVYSLDPVDQARLLAVSFHRLVQRLVKADIPVVLLDFPRLALDADYLFRKLRRFVPATMAQALAAHAEIADPEKIRVGGELAALHEGRAPDAGFEAHDSLNAVALRREVRRLLDELAEAERAATAQREEIAGLCSALDARAVDLVGLAPASTVSDADRLASEAQVATLIATVEQRRAEAEHAATAQREAIAGLRGALNAQAVELAGLVAMLEARNADWQAAQAQIAALTAMAEDRRAEAERAVAAQQAVVADLRGALDARAVDVAGLVVTLEERDAALAARDAALAASDAALEARNAALEATRAQVASLTATAEQWRVDAERAAVEHQEVVAGLRSAAAAQAAALAELATTLEERNADLETTRGQVATLSSTAEQWRTDAERAAVEHQAEVFGLHNALEARAAEFGELAKAVEARDAELAAAQAQIASLTSEAQQWRTDAERAAAEQQAVVVGLRDALGARVAELAEVVAILEARDADLAAARAQIASLTSEAQQWRTDAERAAAERQAVVARLRDALGARVAELAEVVAILEARDADLAAARAQVASLTSEAQQWRTDAERAAVEQQAVVARLRGALDARSAELDGLVGTLQARDTDLAAAQAQIAALTAVAEHMRAEREATLASWTWKAGQPFRLAGSATRAVITALRPGRPPAT